VSTDGIRVTFLSVCLAAFPALAGPPQPAAAPQPQPAKSAKTGIERQEIRAQLLPRRFTTIAAEIGAKINHLPVAEAGAFKAGQLLVGFDCSVQQASLQKARAELKAAEQTSTANKRLAELNSVGKLDVELSRAAVSKATAEVALQQAMLSKCAISAPFSGRVAEQKVREQQYVQPGQPLLDILDDSVLELEFLLPSSWLGNLRVGQGFQVEIDETHKTYPAKLIRIGARVDPVSQSVKVAAAIDGKFPDLIAGMSGRVQISLQPR
jgi:membrane fusion protein, multidrug efflux system